MSKMKKFGRVCTLFEDGQVWIGEYGIGLLFLGKQARLIRRALPPAAMLRSTGHSGQGEDRFWLTRRQCEELAEATRRPAERTKRIAKLSKLLLAVDGYYKGTPTTNYPEMSQVTQLRLAFNQHTVLPATIAPKDSMVLAPSNVEVVEEPTTQVIERVHLRVGQVEVDLLLLEGGARAVVPAHVCAALGVSWSSQRRVLQGMEIPHRLYKVDLASARGTRRAIALDLRCFLGWMLHISPQRTHPHLQPGLRRLQEELYDVLYRYKFQNEKPVPATLDTGDIRHYLEDRRKLDAAFDQERREVLDAFISEYNALASMPKPTVLVQPLTAFVQEVRRAVAEMREEVAAVTVRLGGVPAPVPAGPVVTRSAVIVEQQDRSRSCSARELAKVYNIPREVVTSIAVGLRLIGDARFGEISGVVTAHHGHVSNTWRYNADAIDILRGYFARYAQEVARCKALRMARSRQEALTTIIADMKPIGQGTWTRATQRPGEVDDEEAITH